MAYEMLTGMPPFTGRSPQAVLAAHVVEEAHPVEHRRPAVPPMLATLVRQCLAKRPADRPQSASDLMHVLDGLATPSGGTAPTTVVQAVHLPSGPTAFPSMESGQARRRPWLLAALGAGVVALVGVLVSRPHAVPGVVPSVADSGPGLRRTRRPWCPALCATPPRRRRRGFPTRRRRAGPPCLRRSRTGTHWFGAKRGLPGRHRIPCPPRARHLPSLPWNPPRRCRRFRHVPIPRPRRRRHRPRRLLRR